jgi:hypothetical protein
VIAIVAAAGLGFLALPAMARAQGRRLPQHWWTLLCVGGLAAGSALVVVAGIALSLSTVLLVLGLPRAARACDAMLGHLVVAGSPLGWAVLGLTFSVLVIGAQSLRRSRAVVSRSWVGPGVGSRLDAPSTYEVVVLDETMPLAMSVPRTRRTTAQVVVTRGLLDTLSPEDLQLVLAHEAAHLDLGHRWWLALGTTIERALWFWPPAAASCRALRLAVERCADERATGNDPSARARLGDALVAVALEDRPALAAFSTLEGLVERVTALSGPAGGSAAVPWWPVLLLPGLVLAVTAAIALTHLGQSAYCVLTMAHSCALT